MESLVSRESSFLFGSLVLLTACLVILCGTLFPILSEAISGAKITVDAQFYNAVAVPIGLFLLFLAGVGPLLPWRAASLRAVRHHFVLPAIAGCATAILCLALGANPWKGGSFATGRFFAVVGFSLAVAVMVALATELARCARVTAGLQKSKLAAALWPMVRQNPRRYGGYLIHIGVALVVIGLSGAAFNQSEEREMGLHDRITAGPYTLEQAGATQDSNASYDSDFAILNVYRAGRQVQTIECEGLRAHLIPILRRTPLQMTPEQRLYHLGEGEQQHTIVQIHSTPGWDLYVVYEGVNPSTGRPIIHAFFNPLVGWLWFGVAVIVFGTAVAMVPSRKPGNGGL
jgi:cytochrome c-type biogenesis protein CcmF